MKILGYTLKEWILDIWDLIKHIPKYLFNLMQPYWLFVLIFIVIVLPMILGILNYYYPSYQ